ncbi:MAG: polysaccharide biosynthesis C-terminal domain-containing protein [Bacteroidia bacterium]|nr:polysaccharide biosynthesis C-terminal domain-containing protein [Bacteroidia bacterium]
MSTIKKLAGQTAIYGLSTILGRFFYFLLVPLYTRVFTQVEYGINTEFYAYISFLNILLTHGMETAFFRFAEKENSKQVFANALVSVIGVASFFSFVFLIFGTQISTFIGYGSNPEYVYFTIGILFFDSLSAIPFALLRFQNNSLRFALIKNANILMLIGFNLYLLVLAPYCKNTYDVLLPFYNPKMGISSVFLSNLVASMVTSILLSKEIFGTGFSFNFGQWKKMFLYALPMIWVGLAGMVNETLDRAILRFVWPNPDEARAMNGIYGANYKLSIIITLFIQAFKFAAEPFFFAHSKTTNKKDIYAIVMNYFIWICLFVFLLVMFFLHYFKHFIDEKFYEGLGVVPILLFANIFLGVYYNISIWYKLSDQTKKGAQISIYGAIITIGLNLLLIPKLGYIGCAWTTFLCYLFMMILGYLWGQKYYPIDYNIKRALVYLLIALSFYWLVDFSAFFIQDSSLLGFIIRAFLLMLFIFLGYLFEMRKFNFLRIRNES